MPEFYTIFARKKYFWPEFGGGGVTAPLPPSPTPMHTATNIQLPLQPN